MVKNENNIPHKINTIQSDLATFYTFLYSNDHKDQLEAHSFLEELKLPTLSASDLEALNAPITMDEIAKTI